MLLFATFTMLILFVIGPRRMWQGTAAWAFRHPEQNEPSDASYTVERSIVGVLTVILLFSSLVHYCAVPESEAEVLAAQKAVEESAAWAVAHVEAFTNTDACEPLIAALNTALAGVVDHSDRAALSHSAVAEFGGVVKSLDFGGEGDSTVKFSLANGVTGTYKGPNTIFGSSYCN